MSNNFFMTVARIGKYLVPPPLRPRLREEYSYFVRGVLDRRSKKSRDQYLKHGTYLEWYARDCNDSAKNNLSDEEKITVKLDLMKTGVGQLNTAIKAGLQPHHTLLEFGCGILRAGNHFIGYLNDGNYSANDASRERVTGGKKIVEKILGKETFERKNSHFYINKDNSFDWVDGKKFDFIWSFSVLAHMPETDIECLFDNLKKVMHEKSVFLFTYSCAEVNKFRQWEALSKKERKKGVRELMKKRNHMFIVRALQANRGKDCIEVDSVNWFHTLDFYKKRLESRGYNIEDVTDLIPKEDTPGGFDYASRLAKVTLK